MSKRAIFLISVAAGATSLALGAGSAGATTVRSTPERIHVVGNPGQVNRVTLTPGYASPSDGVADDSLRIRDTASIAVATAGGPRCVLVGPATVDCSPVSRLGRLAGPGRRAFVIDLGDRDDRVTIAPGYRESPEIDVGAGFFVEVRDGPGNDRMRSNVSTTKFVMGPGDDVATGASIATPSGGDDAIRGGVGPDVLDGGPGRDTIRGGDGADTIRGGTGNDRLFGERGNDRLYGGAGNDYLKGGLHVDRLFGGLGRNILVQG